MYHELKEKVLVGKCFAAAWGGGGPCLSLS